MADTVNRIAEHYVTDSNEAIALKFIRDESDLEDDSKVFKPDMSHQVFGENENIFGYRDLSINLYYTAARLTTYIGINYSDKLKPIAQDEPEPDDIISKLHEVIPDGYVTNKADFVKRLEKDHSFRPYGEMVSGFTTQTEVKKSYEIYTCEIMTSPEFEKYHFRLQTFLMWFVDAASFIDTDDEKWRFFLIYETWSDANGTRYAVAGYATVYEYYAYPQNMRPRIAQFLILPPFQRQGLAVRLLQAIYSYYRPREEVVDITVEDPSEEFQRLRDFVDCWECQQKLTSFSNNKIKEGFKTEMAEEARLKLKLSRKQCRRVFEILLLEATNVQNSEDYRNYRLTIKKRLNIPFQQTARRKALGTGEESSAVLLPQEQKFELLENEFQQLEKEYRTVLHRKELQTLP